jgi:hypothetical protein
VPELSRFFGIIIRMYSEAAYRITLLTSTPTFRTKLLFSRFGLWISSQARSPRDSGAWSRRGPNCIRMSCWPTGSYYLPDEPPLRSSR